MRRRIQSVLSGRGARRTRPRVLSTLAVFAVGVLCLVGATPAAAAVADSYEPDGSFSTARPLTVDAAAQQHTIFPAGDQDWVSFAVAAGQTYDDPTARGTPTEDVDTVLYLYDSNGTTQIGWNDDYANDAPYSGIVYQPTRTRRSTRRSGSYYGDGTGTYALSVSAAQRRVRARRLLQCGDADHRRRRRPAAHDRSRGRRGLGLVLGQRRTDLRVATGRRHAGREHGHRAVASTTRTGRPGSYGDGAYDDEGIWPDGAHRLHSRCGRDDLRAGQGVLRQRDGRLRTPRDADRRTPTSPTAPSPRRSRSRSAPPRSSTRSSPTATRTGSRSRSRPAGSTRCRPAPGTPPEDPLTILPCTTRTGRPRSRSATIRSHVPRASTTPPTRTRRSTRGSAVGHSTGTYALSVTRTPDHQDRRRPGERRLRRGRGGRSVRRRRSWSRTMGVAPLDVGDVQLAGAGFSIVRDEAGGTAIPVGGSREIEVAYAPTVAYTGPPSAVQHDWTSLVVQYRYSGGILIGYWLYSGFQNTGRSRRSRLAGEDRRAGDDGIRRRRRRWPLHRQSGREQRVELRAGGVARAGERRLRVHQLARGPAGRLLHSVPGCEPVDREQRRRRARRSTSTSSASPSRPVPTRTPPTTTDDSTTSGTAAPSPCTSPPVDAGGSGMSGGLAKTEYSKDGGATLGDRHERRPTASGSAAGARACTPCSTARPTPPATSRTSRAARSRSTPARRSRPTTPRSPRTPAPSPCTSRPPTASPACPPARALPPPGTVSTAAAGRHGHLGPGLGHRPALDLLLLDGQRRQHRDTSLVQRDDPGRAPRACEGAARALR